MSNAYQVNAHLSNDDADEFIKDKSIKKLLRINISNFFMRSIIPFCATIKVQN